VNLHLVRLRPEARRLASFAHMAGLRDAEHDPGYLWHLALRRAFGAIAPQPFRVFEPDPDRDDDARRLELLGYARVDESGLRAALASAPAEAASIFPDSGLGAKPLPEMFGGGRMLAFSTRVCPVVRTLSTDGTRKRELDAFVHVASADPDGPKPERLDVYRDWLASRLFEGGAELIEARLSGFRLSTLVRRSHASPNGRTATEEGPPKRLRAQRPRAAARRPDATLEGVLRVVDPERFQCLLARGVGRHRAFGFGLLLLRPVG
jgi:CRISPR system Cascade subunit CasE